MCELLHTMPIWLLISQLVELKEAEEKSLKESERLEKEISGVQELKVTEPLPALFFCRCLLLLSFLAWLENVLIFNTHKYQQKKISTMTADEYFEKHPELKKKFDDEIRNDYWGYWQYSVLVQIAWFLPYCLICNKIERPISCLFYLIWTFEEWGSTLVPLKFLLISFISMSRAFSICWQQEFLVCWVPSQRVAILIRMLSGSVFCQTRFLKDALSYRHTGARKLYVGLFCGLVVLVTGFCIGSGKCIRLPSMVLRIIIVRG